MKLLFICNQNKHRSKTAEEVFQKKFETRSAGLYNTHPVSEKDILWADVVLVMEDHQRNELAQRFPQAYLKKRILSLAVEDRFQYNDPQLISLLKKRMKELF